MSDRLFALLVHDHREVFESLKSVLHELSIETYSVSSCDEASELIAKCKPHLVFTDKSLPDGSWVSILNAADSLEVPLSVVVVAAYPDTKLYVSVMQRGAFDFIAAPFERKLLEYVVKAAVNNTFSRREASARAANALKNFAAEGDFLG